MILYLKPLNIEFIHSRGRGPYIVVQIQKIRTWNLELQTPNFGFLHFFIIAKEYKIILECYVSFLQNYFRRHIYKNIFWDILVQLIKS